MGLIKLGSRSLMHHIASVMVMHARDRVTWFAIPTGVLGSGFVICLSIALFFELLLGHSVIGGTYTGALAVFYIVMLIGGVTTVSATFPFAVGFGFRRREYFLGTLAMAVVVSAAWAILLGLLSLIEANVIKNWGVDLHFFHLPFFSDGSTLRQFCWTTYCNARSDPPYFHAGSPLQQFWVSFSFLLFLFLFGLLLGSIYQRLGRIGIYVLPGTTFLLLSVFLLVSTSWHWWSVIFGWLLQQTAASLGLWLVPLMGIFALVSYALLRKTTV